MSRILKKRGTVCVKTMPRAMTSTSNYGRRFAFAFAFAFMFEPGRFAFAFVLRFVLGAIVLVAIGVGVATLVRLALLLLTLLFAASPQAAPSEPSAKTAVSAIFFIILN